MTYRHPAFLCDMCDKEVTRMGEVVAGGITIQMPRGWLVFKPQDYHFCSWSCLRIFVSNRGSMGPAPPHRVGRNKAS